MRIQNRPSVPGVPVGRQRDWIPVMTHGAEPTLTVETANGPVYIDLIAVELAVNGRRMEKLNLHDAAYAAHFLLQRGTPEFTVGKLVGVDYRILREWFPSPQTPLDAALARVRTRSEAGVAAGLTRNGGLPAQCGTFRGYQRHRKRKEPRCEPCKAARRLAERHFKEHGTYVGAPEVAA